MSLTSSAELASGKLVKDEHFTLFEAVSALEVRNARTLSPQPFDDSTDR